MSNPNAQKSAPTTPPPAAPAADPTPAASTAISPDVLALAQTMAKAIVEGMSANAPRRILTVDEVDCKTAFNPAGIRNRTFPRNGNLQIGAVYQNGAQLFEHILHDEEIRLLGKLKPGRFIQDQVVVEFKDHDGLRDIHFLYKCGTVGDRMEMKNYFRSMTELFQLCVAEAAERDKQNAN
jgi:hypothetical protein